MRPLDVQESRALAADARRPCSSEFLEWLKPERPGRAEGRLGVALGWHDDMSHSPPRV